MDWLTKILKFLGLDVVPLTTQRFITRPRPEYERQCFAYPCPTSPIPNPQAMFPPHKPKPVESQSGGISPSQVVATAGTILATAKAGTAIASTMGGLASAGGGAAAATTAGATEAAAGALSSAGTAAEGGAVAVGSPGIAIAIPLAATAIITDVFVDTITGADSAWGPAGPPPANLPFSPEYLGWIQRRGMKTPGAFIEGTI